MSKFIQGTIILLFAGLVTRVLGFINRIVIARFIGAEGVGLYMMAFPTFILIVTITQLGLPVAISKMWRKRKQEEIQEKQKNSHCFISYHIILIDSFYSSFNFINTIFIRAFIN